MKRSKKDDSEKANRKKAKRFVYTEKEISLIENHFEKDILDKLCWNFFWNRYL